MPKQLKAIAPVRSVGASTRVEDSRMSDAGVEVLLRNTDIAKLEVRDSQEVVGYVQVLDLIAESYADTGITENSITGLHNRLLRFSRKDGWHWGNYKQQSNGAARRNATARHARRGASRRITFAAAFG